MRLAGRTRCRQLASLERCAQAPDPPVAGLAKAGLFRMPGVARAALTRRLGSWELAGGLVEEL